MSTTQELYTVLINEEMQYSVWPLKLAIPSGWDKRPVEGSLDICNEYINANWTDMRPKTLQHAMASH